MRKSSPKICGFLGAFTVTLVGIAGLPAADAAAQGEVSDNASYKRLISEALNEYKARRWDEARVLFERAHAINPNARTLRGIGMASFEAREYVRAIHALEASLKDQRRPLTEEQRTQIDGWLRSAYRYVARYRIEIEPADASLTVDGNRAEIREGVLLLDDGPHEIVAYLEGYATEKRRIEASAGTEETLRIDLAPAAGSTPLSDRGEHPADDALSNSKGAVLNTDSSEKDALGAGRLWTWVAAGGAVAFGGAAVFFWLDADARYDEAEESCSPVCTDDEISGIHTADTLGNVFIGLSTASAVAAVVLFFVEAPSSEGGTTSGVSAEVGAGYLQLRGSF